MKQSFGCPKLLKGYTKDGRQPARHYPSEQGRVCAPRPTCLHPTHELRATHMPGTRKPLSRALLSGMCRDGHLAGRHRQKHQGSVQATPGRCLATPVTHVSKRECMDGLRTCTDLGEKGPVLTLDVSRLLGYPSPLRTGCFMKNFNSKL